MHWLESRSLQLLRRITLGAAVVVSLTLAASVRGDEILGRMGTVEIKSSELKKILSSRGMEPSAALSVDVLDRLIRDELARRAILNEARAGGWDKKSDTLDRMERAREDTLISVYVSAISKPAADYPTETEIKETYESNRSAFTIPKQYRVSQIYLIVSDTDAPEKVEAKAKEIGTKAADKNADFGKLALDHSQHRESAVRGGELGWVAENQLIQEVRIAIQSMTKGAVSKPIRSSSGFHIIKLLDSKEASERPLTEVRAQVVESLRQRKTEANGKQYVNDLAKKAPITVNQVELSKYAQPAK